MSIIFGIRNAEGNDVEEPFLLHLAGATGRYAPDGTYVRAKGNIGMGLQPFHTHQRSNLESRPVLDDLGNMVVMDGRLDNHKELCELLGIREPEMADSQIVLKAFLRWGEECFAKFVGDWALAIWAHKDRSLCLARDHAGTRTLYFEEKNDHLLWATFLETFFLQDGPRSLDETFTACYLACQPIGDRTPYRGIRAVPPAHYVIVDKRGVRQRAYWAAIGTGTISYATDAEYEEHFLALFRQSVERRTSHGAPTLVHLSGGMDSTSILCMADEIEREKSSANALLVDTLSYFDPSEPHWNEQPFISVVESHRNKTGTHLELSLSSRTFVAPPASTATYLLPGLDSSSFSWEQRVFDVARQKGARVFITGNGGDEVLGGVPTSLPELADYLVSGQIGLFFTQATRWCLANRSAMVSMAKATVDHLVTLYGRTQFDRDSVPSWIESDQHIRLLERSERRSGSRILKRTRPSRIENQRTWLRVLECLPHLQPGVTVRYEYRYPYLDRNLVEFLFSIPREQLVRPGRRRSLMRRALRGIVPSEILERKRKAFCARGPMLAVASAGRARQAATKVSTAVAMGVVNQQALNKALNEVVAGNGIEQIGALMRVLNFDSWVDRQIEIGHTALRPRT